MTIPQAVAIGAAANKLSKKIAGEEKSAGRSVVSAGLGAAGGAAAAGGFAVAAGAVGATALAAASAPVVVPLAILGAGCALVASWFD